MRLNPLLPILSLVGAIACSGKTTSDSAAADGACAAPSAVAGVDQTALLGAPVGLDASGSVVCPRNVDQATYTWAFVQVPPGSTVDENLPQARVAHCSDGRPARRPALVGNPDGRTASHGRRNQRTA